MDPAVNYSYFADLYDDFVIWDEDKRFFIQECASLDGPLLELMCGTGRLTVPLTRSGVNVTAVDINSDMLAILRTKVKTESLPVDIVQQDVTRLSLDQQYPLIILPFQSFGEILEPYQQLNTLRSIREHMTATGRFICTLHNPPVRTRGIDGRLQLWHDVTLPNNRGQLLLWGLLNQREGSALVSGYEFLEHYILGKLVDKRCIPLRFYLPSLKEFRQMAYKAGMKVGEVYGDYKRGEYDPEQSPYIICVLNQASKLG